MEGRSVLRRGDRGTSHCFHSVLQILFDSTTHHRGWGTVEQEKLKEEEYCVREIVRRVVLYSMVEEETQHPLKLN